ncbi:MAG TPA: alkaline phosphatase family protein, partial [Candidatus Marinimicrobia bacterium]|nr:alkaline phosphatase family protein [Candidatus Neomarinimicrobiota bacterium]
NDHPNSYTGGAHGYDPIHTSMHGIFIASGPAFKNNFIVNSFQNIHLYDLISHILGINPTENDGSLDSISVILK